MTLTVNTAKEIRFGGGFLFEVVDGKQKLLLA